LTPEQKYLKAIHAALDETMAGKFQILDDKMITAGRTACNIVPMPGATHGLVVGAAAKGLINSGFPDPFGSADVMVTAAEQNLCPTLHYAKSTSEVA